MDELNFSLASSVYGITALAVICLSYLFVVLEERLRLRKSMPVMIAGSVAWVILMLPLEFSGRQQAALALEKCFLEFVELFLFLLSAMTYVASMQERGIFSALQARFFAKTPSLKRVYWITGVLSFVLSPLVDNLTTALVMGAVLVQVARHSPAFLAIGCVNIVVAANAGGVFSPFGDITSLLMWQKGVVQFNDFPRLIVPSLVNWLVPALIMSFWVHGTLEEQAGHKDNALKPGALGVVALFVFTLLLAISSRVLLDFPAAFGMVAGLALLKFYAYFSRWRRQRVLIEQEEDGAFSVDGRESLDVYRVLQGFEWDTMMFFYGVILCVGALDFAGYLSLAATALYGNMEPWIPNILVGLISSILDNIPVVIALLAMNPEMDLSNWLLVTLTAGVGGSLLSIGSAAGVALMGQLKGVYTFKAHLKWAWAIFLGFAASIIVQIVFCS